MPTADIVNVSDSLTVVKTVREREKTRIISETIAVSETIVLYKNGELVLPPLPPKPPEVPNLIGFRQQAVRAPRRAPRAILIEAELTNVIIAPLKLSDGINNKAIAWIRPRDSQNVALSPLAIEKPVSMCLAFASIKIEQQPMVLKAQLRLSVSSLNLTTAKLRLRAEEQSIHALKAVNFEKMYKLTRIMKIAMLAESL